MGYIIQSVDDSCKNISSKNYVPKTTIRKVILFYVTLAHLQVFLRTLESNLVYAESSNRIFGNRKTHLGR